MPTKLRFVRGLKVTDHAVERYIERVQPAMTFQRAKFQLEKLVTGEGVIHDTRPECLKLPPEDVEYDHVLPDAYVELGSTGIYCIVVRTFVVTVVCRGGISSEGRARKNARKQYQRARQRERRGMEAWIGSSAPRWR